MSSSTRFTAAGMLRAAIQEIENRHINGEEADEFYEEIQNFEDSYDATNAEERSLLKEANEQLKLHGFRPTRSGLQYNLWKDTFLPKPDRTPDGDITNGAVVSWYDAFSNGKEMDADSAWLFTQWKVTLADETYNERYVELWQKAFDLLDWQTHEDDFDYGPPEEDNGFSMRHEIGVNGGSAFD